MVALKLRQAIVYAATGLFFTVAALSQIQGASTQDTVVKAVVSCAVLVALGLALVRIVEDAERKELAAVRGKSNGQGRHASSREAAAEKTGNSAT